jgi:hypothetical protein
MNSADADLSPHTINIHRLVEIEPKANNDTR